MKLSIYLIFITFLLVSCNKDDFYSKCVEDFFEEHDIVPSDGTNIGCSIYIELWTKDDLDFFTFGSHCIDMVTDIRDCEGNIIPHSTDEFYEFFKNATHHGIIGVYE